MSQPTHSLFFYGTLRDPDLRELILGRAVPEAQTQEGVLRGYCAVRVVGRVQPGLSRDPKRRAIGDVVSGLTDAECARLSHYERGSYDMRLKPVVLESGTAAPAWVFFPRAGVPKGQEDWRLATWQRRFKRRSLVVAKAWMEQLGESELRSLQRQWSERRQRFRRHAASGSATTI